jgi:uncharacterized membrane protein
MLHAPWIKQILNGIKPHSFFLVAAFLAGTFYFFVTPPLQAPDEQDHFKRAYHVSTGHFLPQKKGLRLGGEVPVSFKRYMIPYRFAATNLKYTLNKTVLDNSFDVKLDPSENEFDDFPNTSLYSPVCYIPQAIAMYIAEQLDLGPAYMYYLGRLLVFFTWMICMYHLIKIVPIAKWLFTFLILLPMNLFIANSFSADTVTTILSLSLATLVLKYTFDDKAFTIQRFTILLCIVVLLALAKVVYVALLLLFLIIPKHKFRSKKQFLLYALLLLAGAVFPAWWWSEIITPLFTNYTTYDPQFRDHCCLSPCADYEAQKEYILSHCTYFLDVISRSLFDHPYNYLTGYIGSFGNNDIPIPVWLSTIAYLTIVIIAAFEKNALKLSAGKKLISFLAALLSLVLLLLSQHLVWDCVGEGVVDVVQGRYLLPLLPLVFLCFTSLIPKISFNPIVLVVCIIFLAHSVSVQLIYNRYYKESYLGKLEFSSGAEAVNKKGFVRTSDPLIKVEAGGIINDSVYHSGRSSLLLSKDRPFGFTYKFKHLGAGDLIEMSAWQKGDSAQMIISNGSDTVARFYYNYGDIKYTDSKGWKRMEYAFTIPEDHPASDSLVGFYIWNPTKEKIYIDDLKFSIKKFARRNSD